MPSVAGVVQEVTGLGIPFNFDNTEPAGAKRLQPVIMTKSRDINPQLS